MIIIIAAISFILPTIYYRMKLNNLQEKLDRHIKTRWQWEEWGE